MININKTLTVVSRDGAASTVIRFSDAGATLSLAVEIEANAVTFGTKNKGFTVLGNGTSPCAEAIADVGVTGTTVEGNIARNCGFGILDFESGITTIKNNRVSDNTLGILMVGGTGMATTNVASFNGTGMEMISGTYTITKNAVAGSRDPMGFGMFVESGDTVTKNSITGGAGSGIGADSAPTSLTKNSIFGNGLATGANHNCGINNTSGGTITATGNYWGTASGPGSDPADKTCGDPVTAMPAAETEIKVLVPPIR